MSARRHFLLSLCIALAAGIVIALFVLTPYAVPTGYEPMLYAGDRVVVTRTDYGLRLPFALGRIGSGTPRAGHWIVFDDPMPADTLPGAPKATLLGCCTAVPGDTVWYTWNRQLVRAGYPSSTLYPFEIPGKNHPVKVTPWNIRLLCNTLNRHEGRRATIVGDTALLVDGRATDVVRFEQDYFWVETGRRGNLFDSRYFGFVPRNHLIGRARFITLSKDPSQPFYRGFRPNRFFTSLP